MLLQLRWLLLRQQLPLRAVLMLLLLHPLFTFVLLSYPSARILRHKVLRLLPNVTFSLLLLLLL